MEIASAVEDCHNSRVDVKSKIGNKLIKSLDQIFKLYFQESEEDFFEKKIGEVYVYLHEKLEFPVDYDLLERITSQYFGESSNESSEEFTDEE